VRSNPSGTKGSYVTLGFSIIDVFNFVCFTSKVARQWVAVVIPYSKYQGERQRV
jgi:hypothetical protein